MQQENFLMQNTKKRILYLILVLGVCYILGIFALFTQGEDGNPVFNILQKGFTAVPVLAAFFTRKITKDHSPWNLSLRVWKNPGLWLFCAVMPGLLVTFGAFMYFMRFPQNFSGVFHYGVLLGNANGAEKVISSVPMFCVVCIILAAVFIPLQLLELGEEIGWRGYLLPLQIERYGTQKAVLLNSFLWGLGHMPLIYFGFNYSKKNVGAPWSNMALMMLLCLSLGIICSYVTIKSKNCMYAAIVHGVINLIGELPVFLSVQQENGLLGPNPTGFISMSGLLLCAIVLFVRLKKIDILN